MFCIIAFVVLSILGIFSASNRQLAREALDCVFRRVTLRPCNTGFDEKMKAKILGVVITRSESAAMVLNKNFELLAWVFFVLLMASSVWSVRGVFLFYTTGSCNGLNASAFCVFDPKGENNQVSAVSQACTLKPPTEADLSLKGVDLTGFAVMNPQAADKIVFIGCYQCDYTRKAYPMIRDLVKHFNVSWTFADYPVKEKSDYLSRVGYCVLQQKPEQFWTFNDALFAAGKADVEKEAFIKQTLTGLGVDADKIQACATSSKTEEIVTAQLAELVKTRFYGTPTIFINGKAFVGPKPYRVYAIEMKGLLYWLR